MTTSTDNIISCYDCKHAGKRASFHGEYWRHCNLLNIGVESYDHQFRKEKLINCPRHKEDDHDNKY